MRRVLFTVAVSILAAGCSSGRSDSSPSPTFPVGPLPVPTARPSGGFTLAVAPDRLNVPQGGSATLEVAVARDADFDETITITIDGLPSGVSATELRIAPPDTNGRLTLTALPTAAAPSPRAATVRGESSSATRTTPIKLTVRGAPGEVDRSFGSDGWALVMHDLFAIATLPDGKILVAGNSWDPSNGFPICRLEPDGAPDPSFGAADGCRYVDVGTGSAAARVIEVRSGMIYVAGQKGAPAFLARLDAGGTLDPTFGGTGVASLPEGFEPNRIRFDDGGILVSGLQGGGGALVRVRTDGSPDVDFAARHAASYGTYAISADLVRFPDGRLFLSAGQKIFAFHADGSPDTSFGSGGSVTVPIDGPTPWFRSVHSLSSDAHGGLVAGMFGMAVTRVSAAGNVTGEYGPLDAGKDWENDAFTTFPSELWVLDDGTMILVGTALSTEHYVCVGRRLPDGTPDSAFGTRGVAVYRGEADGRGIEVLPDGRYLVLTGKSTDPGEVVRIWN